MNSYIMIRMNISLYLAFFLTSLLGLLSQQLLFIVLFLSLFGIVQILLNKKKEKNFFPKSENFKELEKIKKQQIKRDNKKEEYIRDQLAYIENIWGYSKVQEKIVQKFLEQRAYEKIYNKFTASLIPQIILLIENCNAQEQKGCKREVSSRLRELTTLMQEELKRKRIGKKESFEIGMEVYDHLLSEVK